MPGYTCTYLVVLLALRLVRPLFIPWFIVVWLLNQDQGLNAQQHLRPGTVIALIGTNTNISKQPEDLQHLNTLSLLLKSYCRTARYLVS